MTVNTEYKVLARKYRPKKFSDLVGQNSLVQILSNAITNDRLAHAYVLTGVRGVGKTTTARLIAMSINCQKRQNKIYEPCGDCDSCKSTGIDNNLDVIEMDAASNTGVDDIREIMFDASLYDTTKVGSLMHAAPEYIYLESDPAKEVMRKFQDSGAWNLPVIKDGKYHGFISKSKLLTAYRRMLVSFSRK